MDMHDVPAWASTDSVACLETLMFVRESAKWLRYDSCALGTKPMVRTPMRMPAAVAAMAASIVWFSGCSGRTTETADGGAGVDASSHAPPDANDEAADAGSGNAEADGAAPATVTLAGRDGGSCTVDQVCALHETPVPPPNGEAALVQAMAGDWALCNTTSVFGTHEAGFSFVADGTWYKLYAQNGTLVRGQGFDEQGTWDTSQGCDGGCEPQLNLNIAGGGGIILFPAFATNPRKMRLDNEGVFVADYVFAACP
jgi:hypothetical protein